MVAALDLQIIAAAVFIRVNMARHGALRRGTLDRDVVYTSYTSMPTKDDCKTQREVINE